MRKDIRFEQVLTQMVIQNATCDSLAKRIGVHRDTMRRKLCGETSLSLGEAFAIRRALNKNMPLDVLFKEADQA